MEYTQSRRYFLAASMGGAAGATLSLSGCAQPEPDSPTRPNFLFAIADDWSFPHAGAYGDKGVKTPTFDRLAQEGVLFTHSFCASPSCTPSRSTVLAGRHIFNTGEAGVLYGTLPAELPLFPHALEDAGYVVGHTGKGWAPGDPTAGGQERPPLGKAYQSRLHLDGVRAGLDPRDYAANFADFLAERPADQPFFFWLGATEPHRVYAEGAGLQLGKQLADAAVPGFWPAEQTIQSDILDYYTEVEWFDAQVGRALEVLEQAGERDNTMVIVTSDNGMPFPRAKVNLYDAGVRMPLAIHWPGRMKGGRVVDDIVSHVDFATTMLEAAGMPPLEGSAGRSLMPLLEAESGGSIDPARDHAVSALERHTYCRPDGATYPMRALRTRDYLYIRNFEAERWPTGGPTFISSNKTTHGDVDACPTKDFFLNPAVQQRYPKLYEMGFGKRPAEELYAVNEDPDQLKNLAGEAEFAGVLAEHRQRLEALLREQGDPRIRGEDPWQDYVYRQTIGFGASMNRSLPAAVREAAAQADSHKPE
jgi:N-sulfoglucosamine sulfohydrolase